MPEQQTKAPSIWWCVEATRTVLFVHRRNCCRHPCELLAKSKASDSTHMWQLSRWNHGVNAPFSWKGSTHLGFTGLSWKALTRAIGGMFRVYGYEQCFCIKPLWRNSGAMGRIKKIYQELADEGGSLHYKRDYKHSWDWLLEAKKLSYWKHFAIKEGEKIEKTVWRLTHDEYGGKHKD